MEPGDAVRHARCSCIKLGRPHVMHATAWPCARLLLDLFYRDSIIIIVKLDFSLVELK